MPKVAPAPTLTAEDKKWRAQSDADTLARAQEILGDRSRRTAAQRHAEEQSRRYATVAKTAPAKKPVVRKGK